MAKKSWCGKLLAILVYSLILMLPSAQAFARDRGRQSDRQHGREVVTVGHRRYNYHDGRFFRPGWFGFEIAIGSPPRGAIVTYLPFGHKTIIVGGITYYYYDNVYYTTCPSGYVVVPAPAIVRPAVPVVAQPQKSSGENVVINVPNSDGSYTAVTLTKYRDGYIGPQGEYYPGKPTVEQLKALYGK